MARITHGVPKADKSLKTPHIDWTGHPVRDGRGYYGDGETDVPAPEAGAFPPKLADFSRLRQSPSEALKAELAAAQGVTKTVTQTVTYRDGAEVRVDEDGVVRVKGKSGNALKEFWARLRADPAAMEAFLAKKKAGFEAWRAKRKAK